jgi:sugar lactone lactonase YvrE
MDAIVFDKRICQLGEGPLWHPLRKQLFWFDIIGKKLLTQINGEPLSWDFTEHVSAAGWIDLNTLLVASERGLYRFDILTGQSNLIIELEADNNLTRSNDGRADPWGGFWISTMGLNAEPGLGSIYRFYRGEIVKIYSDITIPNSIAFSPDKKTVYYTDTVKQKIMRNTLSEKDGWPEGPPELFVDMTGGNINPDGSVVDSDGCLWNAQWGSARVAQYSPTGIYLSEVKFPADQISCPAFGGPNMSSLFATSAAIGQSELQQGKTFTIDLDILGQEECQVII